MTAFRNAVGFGSETEGGRGGRILFIDNLNGSGLGSLRAAVETTGPRIIIPRVKGIIRDHNILRVNQPFMTLAMQVAQGDLVYEGMISVQTHDVVIRGFKGWGWDTDDGEGKGNRGPIAVEGTEAYNVVIDHWTAVGGIDENAAVSAGAHHVTYSWGRSYYALNNAGHPKGAHSKGLMNNNSSGGFVSFLYNLTAHDKDRNPEIKSGFTECIGHVAYNYGDKGGSKCGTNAQAHYEKCKFIEGPDTPPNQFGIGYDRIDTSLFNVYLRGNIGPGRLTDMGDEYLVTDIPAARISSVPLFEKNVQEDRPVEEVAALVIESAGALPLDSLDLAINADIANRTGTYKDRITDIPWPTLGNVPYPVDSDGDGIPDYWETQHGDDLDGYLDSFYEEESGDNEPPMVDIILPRQNVIVGKKVTIAGTSSDNINVERIELWANTNMLTVIRAPRANWSWTWNVPASQPNGECFIQAKSFDDSENMNTDMVRVVIHKFLDQ